MKYGFLFGAGAEAAYGLPSGGKFALEIFRHDTAKSKEAFKNSRDNVDTHTAYANDWLPEGFSDKNISTFGKTGNTPGSDPIKNDGYSAYRKLDRENPDIVFAGCWSHARRRFAEALKALPKAVQKNAKETIAYKAVSRIAAIYHLDNQMEGQPAKARKMYRQTNIRPLVEAFFAWAKEIQSKNQLSRGKTLDGINYCINQEASLKAFLEDGDIPMDNNATESALRSFCLHKHTWKLIDSLDGANASAIIYSITETAKANNLNPFRYLEYILTVLKDHQEDKEYSFIDDILPWSEKLPEICRSKTKTINI